MQQKKSCNSEENKICYNNHSNKSSSFLGHKPKMKHRKMTSLESVAPADSNGLQKISKVHNLQLANTPNSLLRRVWATIYSITLCNTHSCYS
jgi:hypothetical protein